MIVIVVGQGKGGVGKTTLAVNLAGGAADHGRSVTLIDVDPQGSATRWAEPRKLSFPVRQQEYRAQGQLVWVRDVLKTPTDLVVLDLPSGFGPAFDTAALIADLLVVPCGPSSLDISSAEATVAKAREVRRNDNPSDRLKITLVPTRVDHLHEESAQIGDILAGFGEPVGPALSYDIDFVRSFTAGVTVSELPGPSRAAEQADRLSMFLLRQVLPRLDVAKGGTDRDASPSRAGRSRSNSRTREEW